MDLDLLAIRRMKNGDDDAIDGFVRKYYPAILRYCRLHLGDPALAEDMTQETFVRFFRSLDHYQHYGKAANYLYVIAANCCRDHYRKPSETPLEALPEQADHASPLEEKLDVHMALARLPQELREVTILYFFQQCKQAEIAKILGIGLPLVKYRLKRAKELLRAYLAEEEIP